MNLSEIVMLAVAGVAVVALGLAVANLLRRRRRDVWRDLARKHRFRFVDRRAGPEIAGTLDDRTVRIGPKERGSDTLADGVQVVSVEVSLEGAPAMNVSGVPGLIGDLAKAGHDRIATGAEDFDRDVLVESGEPHLAQAYWNEERRKAFLYLVHKAPCDQIRIHDRTLAAEWRSVVSDREQVDRLIDMLLAAARSLDDRRPAPGGKPPTGTADSGKTNVETPRVGGEG